MTNELKNLIEKLRSNEIVVRFLTPPAKYWKPIRDISGTIVAILFVVFTIDYQGDFIPDKVNTILEYVFTGASAIYAAAQHTTDNPSVPKIND